MTGHFHGTAQALLSRMCFEEGRPLSFPPGGPEKTGGKRETVEELLTTRSWPASSF